MKFILWLLRFIYTMVIFIIGIYTTISLAVAFFVIIGILTPGEEMWIDIITPTLADALVFAGVGAVFCVGFAVIRKKLSLGYVGIG